MKAYCPSCACEADTYVMTADDLIERGARYAITNALTGISRLSLFGKLIAADTPLCGGCDAEIDDDLEGSLTLGMMEDVA